MKTTIFQGPPGTGKTTRLLETVEAEMERGVSPDRIAFVTFSRKAAAEARARACDKFSLSPEGLPYFRTLHSFAYRQLGIGTGALMTNAHYHRLGQALGLTFTSTKQQEETLLTGKEVGDKLRFVENLSRLRCTSLRAEFDASDADISWLELDQYARALQQLKEGEGLLDYTDMLTEFVRSAPVPKLEVVLVDEAQDLSKLQWRIVDKLAEKAERVYIAGDDDQAIYRWAGADVDSFIDMTGERQTLSITYRLTPPVHKLALRLLTGIRKRREKEWSTVKTGGAVERYLYPDDVNMDEGTWLVLARNNYMLGYYTDICRDRGYAYATAYSSPLETKTAHAIRSWEQLRAGQSLHLDDVKAIYGHMTAGVGVKRGYKSLATADPTRPYTLAELQADHGLLTNAPWPTALDRIEPGARDYFALLERRGETGPRIKLSTIHGAKGGEADHVLLVTDMSRTTYDAAQLAPDDEARVFYVGATRAANSLHLVMPQTGRFFEPIVF